MASKIHTVLTDPHLDHRKFAMDLCFKSVTEELPPLRKEDCDAFKCIAQKLDLIQSVATSSTNDYTKAQSIDNLMRFRDYS